MPALYSVSSDDDSRAEGNGGSQRERCRANNRDGAREDQAGQPADEAANDSDYIWDGEDVDENDYENWGRQDDKDYNFDQEFADDEADKQAGIFARGKVQGGYDYLKGAP